MTSIQLTGSKNNFCKHELHKNKLLTQFFEIILPVQRTGLHHRKILA